MADTFITSYTCLKDKPRSDRAMEILKTIGSLVKPIMRKHGWVLPVFSEFFPDQPNLLGLNVNAGQKILVRLRPPNSPDTFLEVEDVVQTMLHELTHNVHGPHDDKFYKFLSGLQDEYDALQRSGYAGEGFYSPGNRVGTSRDLTPRQARLKAIEAAERRQRTSKVLGPAGGRRMGGRTPVSSNLTPRQAAAMAAERRMRDEKSCGQGSLAASEADKALQNSVVIDLTRDSPEPTAAPSSSLTKQSTSSGASRTALTALRKPNPSSLDWACTVCTLLNKEMALQCDACFTERPAQISGWGCLYCGQQGISHDFWSCTSCGQIKLRS